MGYINEREAYRLFHAADRARVELTRKLRAAGADVRRLEAAVTAAEVTAVVRSEEVITEWVTRLSGDKAFLRVLKVFTGHTPYGWRVACGPDGRMLKLLRTPGWPVLEEVIRRVRWNQQYFRHVRGRKYPEIVRVREVMQ